MARQRSLTRWQCTYYTCKTLSMHKLGMRVSLMCNTAIINLSVARLAAVPFRWVCDFNHCVWLMLQCLMRLHRYNFHMYSPILINQPGLLNASNTSTSTCMISWIIPMPSTRNKMTNIGCHISFRWVKKFGCIYINNLEPIGSSDQSNMGLTPSPWPWETIFSSSTFPHSLACTQHSMWTAFNHTFHHYLTHQTLKNN